MKEKTPLSKKQMPSLQTTRQKSICCRRRNRLLFRQAAGFWLLTLRTEKEQQHLQVGFFRDYFPFLQVTGRDFFYLAVNCSPLRFATPGRSR
ncbi:hypothetical protein CDAR_388991 [Caerostris darwini]|uniref:Uncharacterized protein n=1 Tax=Caerostris darwini TaxID=1538125 RepID=A0AAV4S8E4_9ARAC|nr:hypothetical protein CDAR_388991 [Caerostris darwini]